MEVGRVARPACIVFMSMQSAFAWAPVATFGVASWPSRLHSAKTTRMLHSQKASSSFKISKALPGALAKERLLVLRGGAPMSMTATAAE
eukprot:1418868-Rhodomonas_salina.2